MHGGYKPCSVVAQAAAIERPLQFGEHVPGGNADIGVRDRVRDVEAFPERGTRVFAELRR